MNTKTIDEKAKAYDEAVEKAKKRYNEEYTSTLERSTLAYVFPALKESEDERIMGNIIATIHLYYGEPLEDEAKEMIAWLEKQGKNNMGISEATKQKLEDNLNRALEKETPESFNKFLDEQKPTDTEKGAKGNEREIPNSVWSEEDKKMFVNIKACLRNANKDYSREIDWFKSLRPQPKQEWNEEDEKKRKRIMHRLSLDGTINNKDLADINDWLKSLKDRVQPQSKQEWNEDTQQWIDAIIKDYEGWYDADKDHRATIQVKINILKSLKPQSHWKPSDLPHWKKNTLPNDNTTGFNSDYFCHKGYYINYKELFEKLPKDD